jgi:hypothetical protein
MSNKKDYEKKLDVIKAIEDDRIKIPNNIPIGVYIQEADNLYHWCKEDKDTLTGLGLSWELVKDLPTRTGALREAEALWNSQRLARKQAAEKWNKKSPAAYNLRDELLQYFRFAFRKYPGLLKQVSRIAEGDRHADMIQDLNDLSILGKQNPGLLANINFDMLLLDKAAATADQIAQLLAEVNTERAEYKEAKRIRDQAFTHLKEAVDEIYEYGQFAFRGNDERKKGYRSHYMYMRRKRTKRKSTAEANKPSGDPVPGPGMSDLPPNEANQTANEEVPPPERTG